MKLKFIKFPFFLQLQRKGRCGFNLETPRKTFNPISWSVSRYIADYYAWACFIFKNSFAVFFFRYAYTQKKLQVNSLYSRLLWIRRPRRILLLLSKIIWRISCLTDNTIITLYTVTLYTLHITQQIVSFCINSLSLKIGHYSKANSSFPRQITFLRYVLDLHRLPLFCSCLYFSKS